MQPVVRPTAPSAIATRPHPAARQRLQATVRTPAVAKAPVAAPAPPPPPGRGRSGAARARLSRRRPGPPHPRGPAPRRRTAAAEPASGAGRPAAAGLPQPGRRAGRLRPMRARTAWLRSLSSAGGRPAVARRRCRRRCGSRRRAARNAPEQARARRPGRVAPGRGVVRTASLVTSGARRGLAGAAGGAPTARLSATASSGGAGVRG